MKLLPLPAALALAIAAPAFAQSSVSIYGRLNVTVESVSRNGGDRTGEINNNSSRIGFKGTEDLGGGMKAGFQIEHGFDPSTGTAGAAFWGRQAEVNLSGGFGTVRLGTFTSEAYYATSDYIGMHNHETGDSSDAFYTYLGRNANKVGYMSPSLGGLVLHASVSVAEGTDTEKTYDLAANYDAGPLHLGAGYEKNGDATQFAVRGLYELGAVTLGAYVQRSDLPLAGDAVHVRFSVMYALGASEFHLNVARGGEYANVHRSDAAQYTLGYNYNLSKRTKVYGYYTRIDRDDVVRFYGGNYDAVALGIRHNF
ncbi:MAG: porin [Vitreoscilla sp.]|nr:porin [Vitreoscilla sp.]